MLGTLRFAQPTHAVKSLLNIQKLNFIIQVVITMRVSKFFISTLKEAPSEAELPSHKLMLRAGYIRKLASACTLDAARLARAAQSRERGARGNG